MRHHLLAHLGHLLLHQSDLGRQRLGFLLIRGRVQEAKLALQVAHHGFQLDSVLLIFALGHASGDIFHIFHPSLEIVGPFDQSVNLFLGFVQSENLIRSLHGYSSLHVDFFEIFNTFERFGNGLLGFLGLANWFPFESFEVSFV